jgi:hypothetical protein
LERVLVVMSVCRLAPPYDLGFGSERFKGGVRSRLSYLVLMLILWNFGAETSQYGPYPSRFFVELQAEQCVQSLFDNVVVL